ncbi:MAG: hypothetical protein J0I20_35660 [Chloroflexi bacterium]|nr:hypothetical protein [Chloroflexota bacterium]OJV86942.1 MAG: hypothetical protein BGO39_28480 [Chloroflexi bacterium 54-19]
MNQEFNVFQQLQLQIKPDGFSNLLHNVDWASVLTRFAVALILGIVGFLARFLWKKLKDLNLPDLWKNKADKAVEDVEKSAIKADQLLKAMEANYETKLKELEKKYAEKERQLETQYTETIKQIMAKLEVAEIALTRANDTIKTYEELMDNIQQERDDSRQRIAWLEDQVREAKKWPPQMAELKAENQRLQDRVTELETVNKVENIRRRGTGELELPDGRDLSGGKASG